MKGNDKYVCIPSNTRTQTLTYISVFCLMSYLLNHSLTHTHPLTQPPSSAHLPNHTPATTHS